MPNIKSNTLKLKTRERSLFEVITSITEIIGNESILTKKRAYISPFVRDPITAVNTKSRVQLNSNKNEQNWPKNVMAFVRFL